MKEYLDSHAVQEVAAGLPFLAYPNFECNIRAYPPIAPVYNQESGRELPTAVPKKLIVEAIGHLGSEPRQVLDIGCGMGTNSLYLATHGHKIDAIDINQSSVDWANDRARLLGVEKQFIARRADYRDLASTDRYDAVIATMVMHFLESHQLSRFVTGRTALSSSRQYMTADRQILNYE
jgi:2-polyprenyl-3-methyl-5-hydroxy-6-metoxy-1,4-benzoquinol methylase